MNVERRVKTQNIKDNIDRLSISQEIALIEAFSLGFSLQHTRVVNDGVLAIANKGDCILTITPSGITEYNSQLAIR